MKSEFLYDGYIKRLNTRFEAALSEIEAFHNFEFGDEFEIALCKIFRRALPHKCGICRGYVVGSSGASAGDDIIIYDRSRFPTLRMMGDEDYSYLERIPIEAVYGYIEAKHTIELEGDTPAILEKASSQVRAVKELCDKRKSVPFTQLSMNLSLNFDVNSLLKFTAPPKFPAKQNPPFGMIFARQIRLKKGGPILTDQMAIANAMLGRMPFAEYHPDAAVLGRDVVIVPITTENPQRFVSPFFLNGSESTHTAVVTDGLAFGMGLCLFLYAMDWIQLGAMEWRDIILDASVTKRTPT